MRLGMSLYTVSPRPAPGPVFSPRGLFASGESGVWMDAEPDNAYKDLAGAEPCGPGDYVQMGIDRSGNRLLLTQPTAAARPVYRSADGVQSLELDGSNDALTMTLPAITGGAVVLAGTDGIWIEDDWSFAGGSLSIGPTTVAGLPDGILPVLGNLIGVTIIDRALTSSERAGLVKYYKGRGSKGLFVLGPELVTNGDFSDGLTGWLQNDGDGSPSIHWTAGPQGAYHSSSSEANILYQLIPISANEKYFFTAVTDVVQGSARFNYVYGSGAYANNLSQLITSADTQPRILLAPQDLDYAGIGIWRSPIGVTFEGYVESVSLRKLELQP